MDFWLPWINTNNEKKTVTNCSFSDYSTNFHSKHEKYIMSLYIHVFNHLAYIDFSCSASFFLFPRTFNRLLQRIAEYNRELDSIIMSIEPNLSCINVVFSKQQNSMTPPPWIFVGFAPLLRGSLSESKKKKPNKRIKKGIQRPYQLGGQRGFMCDVFKM